MQSWLLHKTNDLLKTESMPSSRRYTACFLGELCCVLIVSFKRKAKKAAQKAGKATTTPASVQNASGPSLWLGPSHGLVLLWVVLPSSSSTLPAGYLELLACLCFTILDCCSSPPPCIFTFMTNIMTIDSLLVDYCMPTNNWKLMRAWLYSNVNYYFNWTGWD